MQPCRVHRIFILHSKHNYKLTHCYNAKIEITVSIFKSNSEKRVICRTAGNKLESYNSVLVNANAHSRNEFVNFQGQKGVSPPQFPLGS